MRTRFLVAAATALACAAGGVVAAATTTPTDCVVDASSGDRHCFENYRAAIAYATGGAITDAPTSARQAVTDTVFHAEVARLSEPRRAGGGAALGSLAAAPLLAGNPVIGATLFTGTNYTGDSETIRIPKPCVKDGKYDYYFTLGTIGQHAESVQPWANCWIWLHEGTSWDSPRQGPYKDDTPDLGDWKDRAKLMGLS